MSNMSYCRMRNTKSDLSDCIRAVNDRDSLSTDEEIALKSMIWMMFEFLTDNCLIDFESQTLDEKEMNSLISEMKE